MEQFSLEKYLENPNRKVVTRDGKPVRIVCCDLKCNTPIIAAILWNQEREDCYCYNTAGRCANNISEIDLFFADDEEELTEFEKAVRNILAGYISNIDCFPETIKNKAKSLLDLARKELEANYYTKVLDDRMVFKSELHATDLQTAYDMGKQDTLKDLPKWKKATEHLIGEGFIHYTNHSMTAEYACTNVEGGEYYLNIDDLKTLPKEG